MKNYFKRIQRPLVLFVISILVILSAIFFTPIPHHITLLKKSEPQKISIGKVSSGSYYMYTKWELQGDSIGSLPADIDISNEQGELIVSHLESENSDSMPEFEIKNSQNLHGIVRILDAGGVDGAQAVLVIAQTKKLSSSLPAFIALLGIFISLAWMVKIFFSPSEL